MNYANEPDYSAQGQALNILSPGMQGAARSVQAPLLPTLDETNELLCKCEQQARDLADRILGPRPEAALADAQSGQPESNSLRRTADNLKARAFAIANVLGRISTGI